MSLMKGQGKTPEKQVKEVEIGNIPEKEFRIMVVKIIQKSRRNNGGTDSERIKEMFNKDLEELKNKNR